MKELQEIVAAWETLRAEPGEALLATVVAVSGSTYRRPGARMLLTPEGWAAGSISGGCLEGDILKKAWWRTQNGPAIVTYDSTDEDDIVWGFGLGCNGVVQVLLERVSPAAPGPLDLLRGVLARRRPGVVATAVGADTPAARAGTRLLLHPDGSVESQFTDSTLAERVRRDAATALQSGDSRTEVYTQGAGRVTAFLEVVQPPLPLIIFGAGHDALPLVRIAKEVGWHVTVIDTRSAQSRPERFPQADVVLACPPGAVAQHVPLDARTAAVVMTHNYPDDRRVLQTLLASPAGYIGQLGPRARTERLLAELQDGGFAVTEAHTGRLHGPVGLDLGADNPEEIALAIIAEIQAFSAGRSGTSLRDRHEPLHRRSATDAAIRGAETEPATCHLSASSS